MNWYLHRNGEQSGPFMDQEFRQMLADGMVRPSDLVWHDGATDWRNAADFLGSKMLAPLPDQNLEDYDVGQAANIAAIADHTSTRSATDPSSKKTTGWLSASMAVASIFVGLVAIIIIGWLVVFLARLYGAATQDALGIQSNFVALGAGAAAIILAFAAAVLARRSGWRVIADHDAPGAPIMTGFVFLVVPLMLGFFGFVASTTALILLERFADAEPMQQLFRDNMPAGIALAATGVAVLSGALHAFRKSRTEPPQEPIFLQSLLAVGMALMILQAGTIVLISFTGGMPG